MKTSRGNRAFLNDILTAINDIETAVEEMHFDTFSQARPTQQVVLFNLQIIGEASNRLEASLRARYPSVPWSKAIGMRNVIVHGYFAINMGIIWETITNQLPPFKSQIAAILTELEHSTTTTT
jgi:uncharacterized protein with HEPN domain